MDEFRSALAAYDLNPPHIIADGKIHRFSASGDKRDDAGWYVFHGEFGAFGDHRRGLKESWSFIKGKKSSAADMQKMQEAMKKAKAAAAKDEKKRNEDCQKKAAHIWDKAGEGINSYVEKKLIKPYSARLYKGLLAIPLYNDGALQSLQLISPDGGKKFLFGTKKQGGYLQIGEIADKFILCEGWATGCSLHEATGLPVVVGWDAYNLVPVAKIFKKLYPDAAMIVAGDNDYGKAENVGAKYAQLAADAVGGAQVRIPQKDSVEQPERLSLDWNDVGIEGIRNAFSSEERPEEYYPEEEIEAPFRVLGHDKGSYYYLPMGDNQIVELSASSHTPANLLRLADMNYWAKYGDIYGDRTALATAQNHLLRQSTGKGIFRIEDRLRGVGAWIDEGRHVLHCGDKIYMDGRAISPCDIESKYIYEECPHVLSLHPSPLKNAESIKLREICEKLNWFNPLSGSLLAGWCVVAPVCAMLPWRPHIWITGEAQAGKTVVLRDVVLPMVGKMALRVDGGTTEAAIRQTLGHDARPVIYDEAEAESKKDMLIMDGVLMLARKSSSGGALIKGSSTGESVTFLARSAFCFSGINPSVKQRADESRISFLHLCKDGTAGREARYAEWQELRIATINKDYSDRMLARTVANLSTLIANCEIFTNAAALILNDRRAADQIGAMLAGLYLLSSTGKITLEKAKEWISKYDWSFHTATAEARDPEMLIEFISTKLLRVAAGNSTQDIAIGELVNCAGGKGGAIDTYRAEQELRRIGIVVKNSRVYFANKSSNLSALLAGQPWQSNWKRILGDIDGSRPESVMHFFPGWKARAVSIPISIFSKDDLEPPIEF